jgi:hypothetical protein
MEDNMEEIIRLNVGGDYFTTTRSTLTAIPGTYLHSLFSPGWCNSIITKDATGVIFFDHTPYLFERLLSVLRSINLNSQTVIEGVKELVEMKMPGFQREWNELLEYWGIRPMYHELWGWRFELKEGSRLDAQDCDLKWYEAEVMSFPQPEEVLIRFCGWSRKWNQTMPVDSLQLAPLNTHTPKWREGIQVGSYIEVRPKQTWHLAKVISRTGDSVKVEYCERDNTDSTYDLCTRDYDLNSIDTVTYRGVHVRQK